MRGESFYRNPRGNSLTQRMLDLKSFGRCRDIKVLKDTAKHRQMELPVLRWGILLGVMSWGKWPFFRV